MNDEANVKCNGLRISEAFQRQYATVVLQLKEANKQVSAKSGSSSLSSLTRISVIFVVFCYTMVLLCAMGIENQKFHNETMDIGGSKDFILCF
jgi:hypothetical protein